MKLIVEDPLTVVTLEKLRQFTLGAINKGCDI